MSQIYSALDWLSEFDKHRATPSNLTALKSPTAHHPVSDVPAAAPSPSTSAVYDRTGQPLLTVNLSPIGNAIQTRLRRLDRIGEQREDAGEGANFAQMMVDMLRKFPSQQRSQAKIKIHQLLFQMGQDLYECQAGTGTLKKESHRTLAWGSWFDHVIGRWDIRERHQVLFVFYEDIVQDPMREVERVVRYLGKTLDRTTTDEIVEHIAFGNKRDNPMTNFFMNQEITPFMRKVKVGDWKNHFTVTQNERFEEEYQQRMAKTSLRFTDEL
ncbi:uncharacterized protein LOC120536461 isoform X3 [Polypterus senegalus]|uniref:uncharacterized protein LOC120536461 isoform X3 n=1 Tax=Polypterus senegalus TaxID=55291 RepID=UPI001963F449|nr:uncharacterized protein LOC120536461 isoform X3 [Polypterus senegalus]